ncbi:hypothetical protein ACI3PF_22330, partial [Lactococcus lactis]
VLQLQVKHHRFHDPFDPSEKYNIPYGRQKFNALIDDINKAKHHVHMEYYIFRMDRMGHEIYDALLAAAKR